jgi:2-iminobutanoate/2-iminopropanoate deaminase
MVGLESRQSSSWESLVKKYPSFTAAAIVAALTVTAAAQQPSPSGFEKKEFTHSAWTKGIFSEAVTVKGFGTGKLIFLAGVGSEDENGPRGNVRHHNDLVAQCEYAFDKIKRVLAAHGADMNHVVKITSYLTDMKNRVPYGQCLTRNFGTAPLPVHTLIGVASLAFPEMMVETDVTAITPE